MVWTENDWLSATSGVPTYVKSTLGDRMVVGNGLGNGARYFDPAGPTEQILDGADGGVAEAWLRSSSMAVTKFKKEVAWQQDLDMLKDAGARGTHVLAMTKVWVSGTVAQKDQWHKYALASFLLGTDGNPTSSSSVTTPPRPAMPGTPWTSARPSATTPRWAGSTAGRSPAAWPW